MNELRDFQRKVHADEQNKYNDERMKETDIVKNSMALYYNRRAQTEAALREQWKSRDKALWERVEQAIKEEEDKYRAMQEAEQKKREEEERKRKEEEERIRKEEEQKAALEAEEMKKALEDQLKKEMEELEREEREMKYCPHQQSSRVPTTFMFCVCQDAQAPVEEVAANNTLLAQSSSGPDPMLKSRKLHEPELVLDAVESELAGASARVVVGGV